MSEQFFASLPGGNSFFARHANRKKIEVKNRIIWPEKKFKTKSSDSIPAKGVSLHVELRLVSARLIVFHANSWPSGSFNILILLALLSLIIFTVTHHFGEGFRRRIRILLREVWLGCRQPARRSRRLELIRCSDRSATFQRPSIARKPRLQRIQPELHGSRSSEAARTSGAWR